MRCAVIAVVAVAFATVANADSCDMTLITDTLTSTDATTCESDSGYVAANLTTPVESEMAIMCTNTACQSMLSQLQEVFPTECTMDASSLYADLITPVAEYCASPIASSTTSTSGSSTNVPITTSTTYLLDPKQSSTSSGSSGSTTAPTSTSGSGDSSGTSTTASVWFSSTNTPTTTSGLNEPTTASSPSAVIDTTPTPSGSSHAAETPPTTSSSGDATGTTGALSTAALVGIIAGAIIFLLLVLLVFFVAYKRCSKRRLNHAGLTDNLEPPIIRNQPRFLESDQRSAGTEYQEYSRTAVDNSQPSGDSKAGVRRRRTALWKDSVLVAARIPIDRIKLGAVLHRGGFGVVHRGRYRGEDVAVKMLLPKNRKNMKHIKAFLSEARLMATLDHPQIVQFVGVAWESLSELYCVTEFMAGGDLRSLLMGYLANGNSQGLDATKISIAYQVACALTYLHSLDPVVLHRDLKSRNILLTTSLDAKITDFGASRVRSDATMTFGVGSALWMAPEVMLGERCDEKADVFSLGVVLSELDTHELPYSHAKKKDSDSGRPLPETAVLQMVSLGKQQVRFSRFTDPDMTRFAKKCVSVDPTDRPTAAEVLYYLQVAMKNRQY